LRVGDVPGLRCLHFRRMLDIVVVLRLLDHRHVLVFVLVVLSYAMLSPSVVLVRCCTIIVLALFAVTIRYRLLTASYMVVHIFSGINTKR
jgi:hypothetical protein